MSTTTAPPPLPDDLLWGAEAIANEINRDVRDTYYLLQKKRLPGAKVGSVWVTTRSRLRRHFEGEAA